ncbi:C protein [Hafnia paralvei]|nr:C protein [Hafnia paralvei]
MSNLLNQPRYEKYAVWLTTGKIAPESGQISPDLAHYGRNVTMY